MLLAGFTIVAIVLRGWGTVSYLRAVWRHDARPSIVSWSLWTCAQMLAFAAQCEEQGHVSLPALVTLSLGVGSLLIVVVSVWQNSFRIKLTKFDAICMLFAVAGLVGWLALDNPTLVLVCSMCADLAAGLPTVIKAWKDPASEHRRTYVCSLAAAIATLFTIQQWAFIAYAFPLYLVGVNVLMVAILTVKKSVSLPAQSSVLVE